MRCSYLDIFHHNIDVIGGFDDLIQADDVRVHEEPQNFDLAPDCR